MNDSGTDYFGDKWLPGQPIYLTDLDRCQPAEALSPEPRLGRWRTLEYETDTLSGVMLLAGPETAAPEITYPLSVSGWHAVSIGIYEQRYDDDRVEMLVRLSGDHTFSVCGPYSPRERADHGEILRELFWRVVDLTDQELVLGQTAMRVAPGDGPGSSLSPNARIAYIKLVPLSDAEVTALQTDRRGAESRRLFAHNDAHGIHYSYRLTTAKEIRRHIEPYRDTDFSRLYWEAGGGDHTAYFSKIGRMPTLDGVDDFARPGDRMHAESWRIFRDQGVDPFQVALDYTHEIGLEFHAGYRTAGFYFPPPGTSGGGATFYTYHPELRGMDRNGVLTPRLAYTYPETRRYVISLLREIAGYEIDGIGLWYNRRPPLVEYEPPLVEGFQAEYGEDPRQLDAKDPRWLSYRARTLTQFMREVREAMDAVAEEQGRTKRIEVSAIVMRNEEENLVNALDLRAWLDEGLVDTLIPYTSEPNLGGEGESWTNVGDAEYFVSLTKGTSCTLALNMMPRQMGPEAYRRRAAALYQTGVESLFFWDSDTPNRVRYAENWNALRRLGHRDEIEAWKKAGEPSLTAPTMAIRKLGDWDLSYKTPG